MQSIKGDVSLDRLVLEIPIFMYKNVFFDGEEKLHPCIFAGKLFAMSRSCLKDELLALSSYNIVSEHLKKPEVTYLMSAFNKNAKIFNAASSGTLQISELQAKVLQEAGADLSYFSHITT